MNFPWPCVDIVEARSHQAGISDLQELSRRARVFVINTYHLPHIGSLQQLLRAIAFSMGVAEWYGYGLETIIDLGLDGIRKEDVQGLCVLVLVMTPYHWQLLTPDVLETLAAVHQKTMHSPTPFGSMIFQEPLNARAVM